MRRVYRRMRVGAAQRELAHGKGVRFLPPEYSYVNCQTLTSRFSGTILPVVAYFWHNDPDHLCGSVIFPHKRELLDST